MEKWKKKETYQFTVHVLNIGNNSNAGHGTGQTQVIKFLAVHIRVHFEEQKENHFKCREWTQKRQKYRQE